MMKNRVPADLDFLREKCEPVKQGSYLCDGYAMYALPKDVLLDTGFMGFHNVRWRAVEYDAPFGIVTALSVQLFFSVN